MPKITDQTYQRTEGYHDASNLDARAQLHRRYSTHRTPWQRWVWDRLDLPAACRVLDIGCGPGGLWSQNRERTPASWEIVLADFSAGMVRQAGQRLGAHLPLRCAVADVQALPFADERFEEDALIVTEAEPLVAYALSTSCAAELRPRLEAFRRLVEREIATHGAIQMSKESGLFEAIKR